MLFLKTNNVTRARKNVDNEKIYLLILRTYLNNFYNHLNIFLSVFVQFFRQIFFAFTIFYVCLIGVKIFEEIINKKQFFKQFLLHLFELKLHSNDKYIFYLFFISIFIIKFDVFIIIFDVFYECIHHQFGNI